MVYKVLVVDDSSFFRRRVTDILNQDPLLEVIDVAVDGQEGIDKALSLKPDVITMDIEMPVLDGISAVKKIMSRSPTAILMFSSLTHQGAQATLDALEAGALDFLPKKFSDIAKSNDEAGSLLRQRVIQLAKRRSMSRRRFSQDRITIKSNNDERPVNNPLDKNKALPDVDENIKANSSLKTLKKSSGKKYNLLAIGTSTGGPIALQKILTSLPKDFPLPIIMIQHMPASFTNTFANRLDSLCKINVKEASDGDILKPGCAYLAPGGRQMLITGSELNAKIKIIDDNSEKITFKPSVDISFGSSSKVFGGKVLGIILTGMGSDGREGSRMLKAQGATIWSQDEHSCVVYGMPQAVTNAGISELSLPIDSFSNSILKEINYG